MLHDSNRKIEQKQWAPAYEAELEEQLSFTNGYLSQTAHFEEFCSCGQCLETYVKDIKEPILNISGISVRLHDERLDLGTWEVMDFYRCLHKDTPLLERSFVVKSPKGHTLSIRAQRQLLDTKELMHIEYEVTSVDYKGPISLLAILGGMTEHQPTWYPLMNQLEQKYCWLWLQLHDMDVQLCCAMKWQVLLNGMPLEKRPIKIEKPHTIGYSLTTNIKPGDTCMLCKTVAVVDSLHHEKDKLIDHSIACLTNL